MAVINNLESTSATDSLSANMGRELNEYIMSTEEYVVSVDERVTSLENNSSGSSQCECETKIWTTAIE